MSLEASPVWRSASRTLLIGSLLALASAVFYGANVPAARVAALAGMQGPDLIFYRAILLVGFSFLLARAAGIPLRIPVEGRKPLLLLALGATLTALLYLTSLGTLAVPQAVVLFYTFPIMIMIATPLIERRRVSPKTAALILLAFLGLVLAIGPGFGGLHAGGAALAVAAALTNTALFFVLGRNSAAALPTMFYTQALAVPLALVFAFAHHGLPVSPAVFWAAPWAIAAVIAGYAIGFVLQMEAGQRLAPARMGLLYLAEPVTSILVAAIWPGEILSPLQMLGVALILTVLAAEFALDRA